MSLPYESPTQSWIGSAARSVNWYLSQLDSSGRLPGEMHDLACYYKWPLTLYSLGYDEVARKVFNTLASDFLTEDGDFRTSSGKSADPLYGQISDSYTNTWPIVAARALDRPDIAQRALACLARRRVAETGGFLTAPPEVYPDRRHDIVTIAGCGNAFLAWERLDEAMAAGDCLVRVLEANDVSSRRFYLYIDSAAKPMTDLDLPEILTVIDMDQPGQLYVYLGMASVFLARLYLVSKRQRFLDAAKQYYRINMDCGDAVFANIRCCKTAWAAAVLYRITGDNEYRLTVCRAAERLLAEELGDGTRNQSPDWSPQLQCDAIGEIAYHLTQYTLELAGA